MKANKNVSQSVLFRPPIVTIMGHVDHGKTSILDKIRESNIASKEAGAITQHIGAYQVTLGSSQDAKKITFVDTPGHEAFAQMRARGGNVADIVILVVAADDGVKEQTREAISHAKEAGVPIIVAINKIDLPAADIKRVKNELMKEGIVVEELGGDVVCCPVSAKTGEGLKELLEMIHLVAEMRGLISEPEAQLLVKVIESHMDSRKGPISNVIVLSGTLSLGDELFYGPVCVGKVRSLMNDRGQAQVKALPGDPVAISGIKEVLMGGMSLSSESSVSEIPESPVDSIEGNNLEDVVVLNLIVKSDTRGTLEAVVASLKKLGDSESTVNIIHQGVGDVNDSDVLLASSASALLLGFHVGLPTGSKDLARDMKVVVKTYDIIYELLEDVRARLKGIQIEEEYKGKGLAVVLKLFPLNSGDVVIGIFVTHGHLMLNDKVRVLREGVEVFRGNVKQVRVASDRVKKVNKGQECGVLIKPQFDIQLEDVIEIV